MKSKKNSQPITPQHIWEALVSNADFKKLRTHYSSVVGNPIWWIAKVRDDGSKRSMHVDSITQELWRDPRLSLWPCKNSLLRRIAQKRKQSTPFDLMCRKHGLKTHCIPLLSSSNTYMFLVLTHLHDAIATKESLAVLNMQVKSLVQLAKKSMECKALSDGMRPRMVALSTVHTIHRLINTTISLDDLYQKLSHLTCQVLRAKRCSVLIYDKSRGVKRLIERGTTVKVPKKKKVRVRRVKPGEGVEGKTFSTARQVLRKNIICVPLIDEDVIGVITLRGKKDNAEFNVFDKEILMTLAEEAVVAIKNAELYEEQKKITFETIQSLSTILGTRFAPDRRISSDLLQKITLAVADKLKLSEDEKQALHYATILKDAGKIGLPDEILKKDAQLTGEEVHLVRQHPVHGARMIQSFNNLKPVAPIILSSHENFDGSGYPNGLRGSQIPIGSRVLAVVNAFDALIAGRPYKNGIGVSDAVAELKHNKGSQFDPHVVDVFVKIVERPSISKKLISGRMHQEKG